MHSGSDILHNLGETNQDTFRSHRDLARSENDESPTPSIYMATLEHGNRKKSEPSAPLREINEVCSSLGAFSEVRISQ